MSPYSLFWVFSNTATHFPVFPCADADMAFALFLSTRFVEIISTSMHKKSHLFLPPMPSLMKIYFKIIDRWPDCSVSPKGPITARLSYQAFEWWTWLSLILSHFYLQNITRSPPKRKSTAFKFSNLPDTAVLHTFSQSHLSRARLQWS